MWNHNIDLQLLPFKTMFLITSLLIRIFTFLGHCPEMEQEAQSAGSILVEHTII